MQRRRPRRCTLCGRIINFTAGIDSHIAQDHRGAVSCETCGEVKWLNKQLSKFWPSVAEAASAVMKESVEPLLEDCCPPGITSLKFSKLTLCTVAPKIEEIQVQSLKKGQIIMDIGFRWGGDPSIILGVEAALIASIPIQLKELQIVTMVHVIFQLAEDIPCISAAVVALLILSEAVSAVIKESVEPLLEEYCPPGITSLKFSKLTLGTVAPKIEEIRVQSLEKGQIIMDFVFPWGGDPSIMLDVEAALVAFIPIQVVEGASSFYCGSCISAELAVVGSLTAIPGLSYMIDDIVASNYN
ncbi:hypothetical protein CCACVL1_14245 [Corchorus capsularis]|uniref:SMP-LTD domain-containing protein n=1 Tax=Corchorus capsularis TaxID=210143 RepID=A0A1R3I7Q6_COCAP|nr:hypothetical protein CCACVL1_14245 [Corchorus capsularis]